MIKKCCLLFIALSTINFLSCSNSKENETLDDNMSFEEEPLEIKDEYFVDSFIDPTDFFTLDYTPYLPEEVFKANNITDITAKEIKSTKTSDAKNAKSVVPGLRELNKYKTKYNTDPAVAADLLYNDTINGTVAENASVSQSNNEPFTVVTWGPQKEIPAKVKNPEFYVMFSEPVVPVAALGSEITTSDIFTIEPSLKGIYRWNGTSTLSFIPSEKIKPEIKYTIKVSPQLKSLSDKQLQGDNTFTTSSEELKITWSDPGYKYKEEHLDWFPRNNVPPEAAQEFRVQFNYDVKADYIKTVSKIFIGNKQSTNFTTIQENENTITYLIKDKLPTETKITLQVESALCSYSTVGPFKFNISRAEASEGKYTNPVYIYFSHPLNAPTVLPNISTTLDYKLKEENIQIYGDTLIIHGLPVTFNSKYKITINKDIEDIYGRKLGHNIDQEIIVPNAESSSRFTDYGSVILEAKYPHVMVFEHQNLLKDSFYSLTTTNKPLDTSYPNWDEVAAREDLFNIPTEPKNQRILEKVDLEPLLEHGHGMVRFEAKTRHPLKHDGVVDGQYENTNVTTVQVTDLGVTARFGINKTAALVSDLSTGKPVENAKVYVYDGKMWNVNDVKDDQRYIGVATTDKDGLAVVEYDPIEASKWLNTGSYSDSPKPAILVTTEDDAVTFYPKSHAPWKWVNYGVNWPSNALLVKPSIFAFTDRGIYKPGETVTYRGIDRNRKLGSYEPFIGEYTITVRKNSYNVEPIITYDGKTSSSGGFYGSFTLPEDLEPGSYSIKYERKKQRSYELINFEVSYFERLKFQASLSMPESPIIAGDKIQSTVKTNYLAGGVLAGASYNESWYSEPWYFTSEENEFKGYRFGPINNTDNMSYLNSSSGNLDGTGKAILSCDTKENSIKGSPYRYRVSADISDVSNQSITRAGAVIVHPAQFYIGISKPKNISYLAKKGEKINFDYKLADVNGKAIIDLHKVSLPSPTMTVELIREDWNVVQQQGVNGYVYPRYVKEEVIEKTETVNLNSKGSISVTPENVGYYTVRLSTKDSKERNIVTEYNFFATGSTNSWVMDTSDTDLRITPDKKMYNPGDKATLLLESPLPAGNYLITVEREGIFTEEVRHFDSAVNTIQIPIARNYLPIVYVSVSSYSVRTEDPKNQYGVADVDKPKGYYGMTQLMVNPYVKAFSIEVISDKKAYKPGEEATITIKATKGGKPLSNAEITLMAVDRGVLDLIDYHVPNPIDFFYNPSLFQFCVEGGDSRAYLMDPVTYAIKNLMGGDAMEKSAESKLNQRKDFNPTALFEPVLITDENGEAKCTFTLPDSLTTYRVTAFGIKDELLALQEDEFAVQNQINVQQVTPRRLRERDTSELGVIVTNLDSIPHEVTVNLEIQATENMEDENGVTKQPGKAFVDGENTHTVTVNPGTTLSVYFDVAAEKAGLINTVFSVNSDIVNEQLIYPVTIEKPYIFEQVTTTGAILDKNEKGKESIIIPSFAEDGLGDISITLDATRLGPLGGSVKYLFDYPYGCLEQQSSKILPLVIFEDYIDVFNMELDEKITSIPKLVKSYFKEWSKVQKSNGGFGYWPSSKKASYYVTTKIAETYGQALKRGYTEDELKINKENLVNYIYQGIIEYKSNSAKNYSYDLCPSNDYEVVYGQYVLSLIAPEKVAKGDLLATLENDSSNVSTLALSGITALNINDKKLAEDFRNEVAKYLRPNTQSIDISDDNYCYYCMYDSKNEQLALTLQLFAALNPQDPLVTKLVFTLLQNQEAGFWQNTATTSRVLDAFYTLIKASDLDRLKLEADAKVNGKVLLDGKFKGPAAKPVKKTLSFSQLKSAGVIPGTATEFTFNKDGRGDLYYTTSMRYALPSEIQIPRDEGLSVIYKLYDDSTGEEITFDKEDSSLVQLESGKIYKVDITLSSTKDRNYIAMRAPVPSGAEILDATFVTTPDLDKDIYTWNKPDEEEYDYDCHYMSNQVIMDNEVQFFWDYFQKGTTTATFKFRAVRRGVFPTPPITAECMYESEVFGRTYGSLFTIK